jgi:hypothetical protein
MFPFCTLKYTPKASKMHIGTQAVQVGTLSPTPVLGLSKGCNTQSGLEIASRSLSEVSKGYSETSPHPSPLPNGAREHVPSPLQGEG